jgi:hypothetical protein
MTSCVNFTYILRAVFSCKSVVHLFLYLQFVLVFFSKWRLVKKRAASKMSVELTTQLKAKLSKAMGTAVLHGAYKNLS